MDKIFKNRLYIRTLISDLISNFGDIIFYFALMNYVLQLPDAKYGIAIISLSETLPKFVGPFTGYFADRIPYKLRFIFMTQLFRFILYTLVGFLMGFTPALWVVIGVSLINFISDIAGSFESGLFIPINLKIVRDEDREKSIAFSQTASQISSLIFNAMSGFLLILLGYQVLAFLDAGSFLLSFLVLFPARKAIRALVGERENIEESSTCKVKIRQRQSIFKVIFSIWDTLRESFMAVRENKPIYSALLLFPFINGILSIVQPFLLLSMSENDNFIIINRETTLVMLTVSMSLFSIIGGIIAMKWSEKISLGLSVKMIVMAIFFVNLGFYLQNIYISFISIIMIFILVSILSPKFSGAILNYLDRDKIATVVGGLNTYLQVGMLFMVLLFSWLITILNATIIASIYAFISLMLFIYVLFFVKEL
ncbi:MFS transporter [Peptoniphilaceae bacterium SGI.131]